MSLGERLNRIWYGGARVPLTLRALVPLYRFLRFVDTAPYRLKLRRPTRLGVPVIVVGNITVGGSGKTPLVVALVEAFRARGIKAGVVSRGYGGRQRKPLLLDDLPDPKQVGDEPTLIRRRTGALVAVGRDRAKAAQLLVERGVSVVIADDGLQNPGLTRDLEICVIDGERRFGNGRLIPAGPLREPVERLARCAFRVCNGGECAPNEHRMQLVGNTAVALGRAPLTKPLDQFAGRRAHAIAGIGHPERFFAALRVHGIEIVPHVFADHHAYVPSDLAFGDSAPLLMTEKDAVKCDAFARPDSWCVPVRAELPAAFFDVLITRLRAG